MKKLIMVASFKLFSIFLYNTYDEKKMIYSSLLSNRFIVVIDFIRVVATTPEKSKDTQPKISDLRDHSQSISQKKKKSCHPYILTSLSVVYDPTPYPPRRFLGDHFVRERKEIET